MARRWTASEVAELGLHTTVETAAEILGISRSQGYALAKRGEFPVAVVRIGRRYVVPVRPLLELLQAA